MENMKSSTGRSEIGGCEKSYDVACVCVYPGNVLHTYVPILAFVLISDPRLMGVNTQNVADVKKNIAIWALRTAQPLNKRAAGFEHSS